MKNEIVAIAALCGTLVFPACRARAGAADTPPSPAGVESRSRDGRVRLDPSQLKQVRVEELSTLAPTEAIRATGTIEFDTDRLSRILPPVSGQVQNVSLNPGDSVRRGDVLFVLSSREVAAAIADHVASQKDLELAAKTFAMTQDLFEHEAASRIALQQAQNELAKSKAKVQQTEEILRVLGVEPDAEQDPARLHSRVPVRAPIGGTVIERTVTNGQFVGPENPPLLVIADLSNVWVQAEVFERDLGSINAGQKADVTAAAYPDDHFNAHVVRIGSVIDPQTRTAKVRFVVANPDGRLKPGMYTSISLYLPQSASSLTVPAKAVFVENSRAYTYVQAGPVEFVRREIETVSTTSDRLRVVRGLKAGDRVVSDGVLLLRQVESAADGGQ
jgi:membrane fusion protein, heavy metal efflux system